jgi:glyoxylase-like metal-dependent hydrolase (beta-lactamase superfamily II)
MKGIILLLSVFLSFSGYPQDRFSKVEIAIKHVAGDVYMLTGAGGNIGVLATDQGVLLVDDQFLPLSERIEQALSKFTTKSQVIRYVINTHHHGDHTGGNVHFGKFASIFAHHNVRKRLLVKDGVPNSALPVITYEQGVTIHLGGEKVILTHLPNGHTDGDTIVYFKNAGVLHTGDQLFSERFPYIDINAGGSIKGYLTNLKALISIMPDDIKVIPGHGQLTNKQGIKSVIEMMEYSLSNVKQSLASGLTREQILNQGLDVKYKTWGEHFISEKRWLETLLAELN